MTTPNAPRPRPHRALCPLLLLALGLACTPVRPADGADPAAALRPALRLPSLGDESAMSLASERELGNGIAREIYRDPDRVEDPLLEGYVSGIWQQLMQAAQARGELTTEMRQGFAWDVMLIRDRSVNAFALPGAYMGVHLGLIGVVGDENELAAVLAHELSHVTQRHISRLMTRQQRQTPWLMGAIFLGMLAASRSPDAAGAVMTGGQALAIQTQLNFSRDMEREADRVGFGVMAGAGYAPQGFVSMFEKLQQASRMNDNGAFPYLRSHPLTTERMADMHARQQLLAPRGSPHAPSAVHTLMAARARVLADTRTDALRNWSSAMGQAGFDRQAPLRQAAALYAAALASVLQREWDSAARAQGRLLDLLGAEPEARRLAQWLGVETALAQGQYPRALRSLPEHAPRAQRAELLLWAQVQQAGDAPARPQAIARLQQWLVQHPQDSGVWRQLAALYRAQGLDLRALRAEAEARAAQYDLAGALDRLKAAQDLVRQGTDDFMEASIIDARARVWQSLLHEEALKR